jgi:hypothetical protein
VALLALVTLGNVTQIELFFFVDSPKVAKAIKGRNSWYFWLKKHHQCNLALCENTVTGIVVLLAMVNLGKVTQIILLYLQRFTQGCQGNLGEEYLILLTQKTTQMSFSLFVKTPVTVTVVLLPLVTLDGTIHIGLFLFVLHPPRWSRQLGE